MLGQNEMDITVKASENSTYIQQTLSTVPGGNNDIFLGIYESLIWFTAHVCHLANDYSKFYDHLITSLERNMRK